MGFSGRGCSSRVCSPRWHSWRAYCGDGPGLYEREVTNNLGGQIVPLEGVCEGGLLNLGKHASEKLYKYLLRSSFAEPLLWG